jgi:hypothetical protein
MELTLTAVVVAAGLAFSFALALLVEEFLFGQLFRLLFAPQKERSKNG